MHKISPQAIVSDSVIIGNNVTVSPFCVIEGDVIIGDNTYIYPFVHIKGSVNIGANNTIFNNASIGMPPQDISFQGSPNKIIIGDNNVIREGVTIHAPVYYQDSSISPNTQIGNDCLLMVNSHIAHNTVLKNHVIFANGVLAAGCCTFDDGAFISGNALIHQHVRVGAYSLISGGSRVGRDIPPFMLVSSFYGVITGINSVGLRRAGFNAQERNMIKHIFHIFRKHNSLNLALDQIIAQYESSDSRVVLLTLDFLKKSKRGISTFGDVQSIKD